MNDQLHPIDSSFQSQHSGKCDLLIHISSTSIAFAIIDIVQDQLKVLFESPLSYDGDKASVLERLDNMLESDRRLKFHYRKIKISVDTFKFTFIPQEIYSENYFKDYVKFISPNLISDVCVNDIKAGSIKNIFAIDAYLQYELGSRFKKPSIFSQATPFIEGIAKISNNETYEQLFINMQPERFEAGLLHRGKLSFYNLFDCRNPDEFNYFLLTIVEQFQLKKAQATVTLSGQINENDEFYNRVQKYFDYITFANSNELISQHGIFNNTPSHHYFSLISLNLCE